RLDSCAGRQPPRVPAARLRAHVHLRRARPLGRPSCLRPRRRDVPRQDRRDRRQAPDLHGAGASVYAGAAVGGPDRRADAARPPEADRARRRRPQPGESAVGLPFPHAVLEGAADLRRGGAGTGRPRPGPSCCVSLRRDRAPARARRHADDVTRRLVVVAALAAAFSVACASPAGANGNQPDIQGAGGGYLSQCLKFTELKEWTCYLHGLERVVLASKNPALLLPNIDVLSRDSGGYLAASCHMMMHVIGRDYAREHHVTLETLQQYLPHSNDPG